MFPRRPAQNPPPSSVFPPPSLSTFLCWVGHPRGKGECVLSPGDSEMPTGVTPSPCCTRAQPGAFLKSTHLIVSPRGGTTLYKSSQYLKTQFKVTGPAYKVALDFSSLLFYHDLKWAHHSNGLLAVLRTANPLSHLHSDAYAASPACHAPVELRLALQGQLRYHPQRPFPFFPPCIFSLMQLP